MNSPDRLNTPNDLTFFLPLHMLWGFAVELYLKSYLAHQGWSGRELSHRDVRHNLEALAVAAAEAGLHLEAVDRLVDLLSAQHTSYGYRYPGPDDKHRVPALNAAFQALSQIDEAVDRAIGASAAYGRGPGGLPGHWTLPPGRDALRIGVPHPPMRR